VPSLFWWTQQIEQPSPSSVSWVNYSAEKCKTMQLSGDNADSTRLNHSYVRNGPTDGGYGGSSTGGRRWMDPFKTMLPVWQPVRHIIFVMWIRFMSRGFFKFWLRNGIALLTRKQPSSYFVTGSSKDFRIFNDWCIKWNDSIVHVWKMWDSVMVTE